MIAVRLEGRLGNQLFQYAFAYAAAKKLGVPFYLDKSIELFVPNKYFNVQADVLAGVDNAVFSVKGFKNLFNVHLRRLFYKNLNKSYRLSERIYSFDVQSDEVALINKSLYIGYFQSAAFFNAFEQQIRDQFTLKKKWQELFWQKYGDLYEHKKIVAVHVRRTDYKNMPNLNLGGADLCLPLSYYKAALANFSDTAVHFVFVTDDVPFVEQHFSGITNKTISADSEIIDFQHLLNADACIIANSTFSWWGAWLNAKSGKTIYCSKYYLGHYLKQQIPQNIYPKDWRLIDFDS